MLHQDLIKYFPDKEVPQSVELFFFRQFYICQLRFKSSLAIKPCYGLWLTKFIPLALFFENEHGQILVLAGTRKVSREQLGVWLAASLSPGETKEATAIRETEEEISHIVDPSQFEFVKTYLWGREDLDITFEVFKLRTSAEAVTLEIDKNEDPQHVEQTPRYTSARI